MHINLRVREMEYETCWAVFEERELRGIGTIIYVLGYCVSREISQERLQRLSRVRRGYSAEAISAVYAHVFSASIVQLRRAILSQLDKRIGVCVRCVRRACFVGSKERIMHVLFFFLWRVADSATCLALCSWRQHLCDEHLRRGGET